MKRLKKALALILSIVLVLVTVLAVLYWTPDTSYQDMVRKYGGGESQFISLEDGHRIHFRDQGLMDGPTLILVHGTSASLHTWEPLIDVLADQYRLVSLDLPGHGLTGQNAKRDYSRQAMVSSIWTLMDHLEIASATMVGNSLGGSIAWASALDKPERVEALILLAPSGAPRTVKSKSNIGFRILKTSIGQSLMKNFAPRQIIKSSLLQSVSATKVVTEEMVDRYWELLRLEGNRQAMIDLANTPRDENAWKLFSTIASPTLVIWGEEDAVLPVEMISTFNQEIRQLTSLRLAGVGHLPMEEATHIVSEQINEFCNSGVC